MAIAGAVISVTISDSKLFNPIRQRIKNWFFNSLITCHFCLNFYISVILLCLCGMFTPDLDFIIQWLVLVFLMTVGSSTLIAFIGWSEKFC